MPDILLEALSCLIAGFGKWPKSSIKEHRITHAYAYFLMELYQQDGLTQAEMHKRIGIEQPTAVRTLDRMERDGLILRQQSSDDRRAVLIKLTAKGKMYEDHISCCAQELNDMALANFTEKERLLFNQLINRLNANLSV